METTIAIVKREPTTRISDERLERTIERARSTTDQRELEQLSKTPFAGVLEAVAHNSHTDSQVLERIRKTVTASAKTPPRIKRKILLDIYLHPNASEKTLRASKEASDLILEELRGSGEEHKTSSLGGLFAFIRIHQTMNANQA